MAPVFRLAPALLAALAIAACQPQAPADAPETGSTADAPALEGGPSGPSSGEKRGNGLEGAPIDLTQADQPSENPCTLFSATEIGAFMGKMVAEGETQGDACRWRAADKDGGITVQVSPASGFAPPTGQPGYEALATISDTAYVVPDKDGYAGGAVDGDDVVTISLSGPLNGRNIAVELLTQALERNN